MPYLKLNTNCPVKAEQSKELLGELSKLVANETGKPERYVMIHLSTNEDSMLFAGNEQPMAYLECKSIGLTKNQAQNLAATLCQFLSAKLEIKPDRIYIEFSNCPAEFWGWNGGTFG